MNFEQTISKYKTLINIEIKKFFEEKIKKEKNSELKKSYAILQKFVLNGGKRLRPIALILTYKGMSGTKDIIRESLSVEFFHNASLIEDDIMDEDDHRRNKPTVHKILKALHLKKYREKRYRGTLFNKESNRTAVSKAILLANILYAFGYECLTNANFEKSKVNEALQIYNDAFIKVNIGQLQDISLEKERATEEKYLEMAKNKSAELVKAAIEIGAILADTNNDRRKALSNYAVNMTIAFQLHDDLMDINPDSKKGHELGSDIRQNKRTLLIIIAMKKADKKQKAFLKKVLGNSSASRRKIRKAIAIIHSSGAYEYSQKLAKRKISASKKYLKKSNLQKSSEDFFMDLSNYVINRNV